MCNCPFVCRRDNGTILSLFASLLLTEIFPNRGVALLKKMRMQTFPANFNPHKPTESMFHLRFSLLFIMLAFLFHLEYGTCRFKVKPRYRLPNVVIIRSGNYYGRQRPPETVTASPETGSSSEGIPQWVCILLAVAIFSCVYCCLRLCLCDLYKKCFAVSGLPKEPKEEEDTKMEQLL